MTKKVKIILSFILLPLLLFSCSPKKSNEPPLFPTFSFSNSDEFVEWLTKEENPARDNIDDSIYTKLYTVSGYYSFISEAKNDPSIISSPVVNEENATSLGLYISNHLYLPEITHCFGKDDSLIKITQIIFPGDFLALHSNMSVSQIIRFASDEAANISNVSENYDNITEEKITVCGEELTALVFKSNNKYDTRVQFIYKEKMYYVIAKNEKLSNEFWENLRFEEIK